MTLKKREKDALTPLDKGESLSSSGVRVLNIFLYTLLTATVVTLIGILLFYIFSLAQMYNYGTDAPDISKWLLGIFSDFVEIMNCSLDDKPHIDMGSSYPPIAIAILYPFAFICKDVFSTYATSVDIPDINELTSRVVCHYEFWIALLLFFIICIVSICILVSRIYKLSFKNTIKASIVIIMSAPFVYAIMRGNTIYFALIFLLLFLLFYRSRNPILREISYICLALAGCIKIYPLFFGVFLLKDKKIFASIRVAVYFILIFVLSFKIFPDSGGAKPLIENLQGFMADPERLASYRNLSLTALLYKIVSLFSKTAVTTEAFENVNLTILIILFVAATVTAIATRSNLSRALICSGIVILIPSITYFYVLVFEIVPFMEYLKAYDTLSKKTRIIYGAMFMFLMFTPILLPQVYIPHVLIIIFMVSAEMYKIVRREIIPFFKNKKKSKKTVSA